MYRITFSFTLAILFCVSCSIPLDNDKDDYTVIDSVFIYTMDIQTKIPNKIAEGEEPIFIPNSNKIVYRNLDKIYTINLDKTEKKHVADASGGHVHLVYRMGVSKDGSFLVYPSKLNSIYNLFKLDINSGEITNLTTANNTWEDAPVISISSQYIAYFETIYFESSFNPSSWGVSIIDIKGDNYKKILHDFTGFYSMSFSTNDDFILITRRLPSALGTMFLKVDIENPSLIDTMLIGENIGYKPILANDSTMYYSSNSANFYVLNLNTKEKEMIYEGSVGSNYSFSNDFKKALFGVHALLMLDLETGITETLFEYQEGDIQDYRFSPDDNKITFTTAFHDEF